MNYFYYEIPEQVKRFLIGNEKEQIIRTVDFFNHYYGANFSIPSESDITEILKLDIGCSYPPLNPEKHKEIKIKDNVTIDVYANAYYYIRWLSQNYEEMKRGDLYKFDTGMNAWGIYLLPEDIMQGLRDYDWSEYKKKFIGWLKEGPENGGKTLRGRL